MDEFPGIENRPVDGQEQMTTYSIVLGRERHVFQDLKSVLACASPLKSGDVLAGIAASSNERRVAARYLLADMPLKTFLEDLVIPYETDEVSRLIVDRHDWMAFASISHMTVGEFRNWLLSYDATSEKLLAIASGLTPEMVAAVSKIMRNHDLITVAGKCSVVTAFRSTIGLPGRLSSRLQPNHPTDDPEGVAGSTLDGLLYGIGDAVIGINPATDNLEACTRLMVLFDRLRERFEIPTQSCVLTHVTTSIKAIEAGAPLDLVFQSIAGSEAANKGFGVDLAVLREGQQAALSMKRGTVGNNVMYLETGQGSALSADAHHGVDEQTIETRAYAVARELNPLLVNTVVGFIGPEYLFDAKQIIRAGLEDHFCGKLLGVPMGVDVCYTNHAEADQDDMDNLMVLLTVAGVSFLIAVPGADDVMLNYQSLSYHDIVGLRHQFNRPPAPEFEAWLHRMGMLDPTGRLAPASASGAFSRNLLSYRASA
ncbi:ethanolamine ammonia-lyase subunit EutB [Rhizobium laguerreae]|uniref:ethanolamine ammonia-lyase subunit EutB n=1 Tax=Rhizobium laguerreae TaxID=1076926 RepID=UPI0014422FFF|nr:ethanolamine ammonia-lyase subunit EutB [Rhizobium laguerreae]MBY3037985.1 ethanolamine ammonia-lyase subunit EutB [Rhizobium laguerreae]NKN13545.1 ethanolamine ammonia-lyase subunit EutB [Rhizobium laguerreae]